MYSEFSGLDVYGKSGSQYINIIHYIQCRIVAGIRACI